MKKIHLQLYCFEPELCEGYSWVEIESVGLSYEILKKMDELGVIEIRENMIRADQIQRIFQAIRLQRMLGVNLAGTGVILKLLDRIRALENEIEELKKQR
ncbi:MAG: hypothetical protein GX996_01805 [Firmicutes bacterium]|nr:hypothetical protein [Bacillota bacterium]